MANYLQKERMNLESHTMDRELIHASEQGDYVAVEQLLHEGASIDYKDADGRTALMAAVQKIKLP